MRWHRRRAELLRDRLCQVRLRSTAHGRGSSQPRICRYGPVVAAAGSSTHHMMVSHCRHSRRPARCVEIFVIPRRSGHPFFRDHGELTHEPAEMIELILIDAGIHGFRENRSCATLPRWHQIIRRESSPIGRRNKVSFSDISPTLKNKS